MVANVSRLVNSVTDISNPYNSTGELVPTAFYNMTAPIGNHADSL